jgi:hypothetical protein
VNKLVLLLILAVAIALAKVVLLGLVIVLLLALSYALITRPRELFLFLGAVTLLGLASAQPTIFAAVVLGLVVGVARAKGRSRRQAFLTEGRKRPVGP